MNKYKDLLGLHVGGGIRQAYSGLSYILDNTRVVQIFISSPLTCKMPSQNGRRLVRDLTNNGVKVFIHSPYTVNLVRKNAFTLKFTAQYIYYYLRECKFNKIPFVLHTGKCTPDYMDDRKGIKLFLEGIQQKFKKDDFHIWLETDPGCKGGSLSTGLSSLWEILEEVGDERFGIVIDTEHAYANHLDINMELGNMWKWIKLVHLNSIPKEVKKGSHLDRHSFTSFEECSIDKRFIAYYFKEAITRNIPIILERRDFNIVLKDFEYLNRIEIES